MFGITLSGLALWGMRLSIAAPVAAIIAIALYRGGVMDFRLPLLGVAIASLLAVLALLMCVIALVFSIGGSGSDSNYVLKAAIGVVLSLVMLYAPLNTLRTGMVVPPIHDISTDLDNPPQFFVVPSRRDLGDNGLGIDPKVQAQQKAYYDDIAPLYLSGAAGDNLQQAQKMAETMGWEIVDIDASRQQIEATATTFLFGFKDDVVIRLTNDNGQTRVDMRSASRVGVSDLGANAARIRSFFAKLGSSE